MEGMGMNWGESRVLVTGATGIVGSWLVKSLLQSGACVAALVRDWDTQCELIRSGDIDRVAVVSGQLEDFHAVERALNEHEIDTVFHLGAQTIVGAALRSPLATFESNIRGTYHVLEACRIHRATVKRVVVASSDKAYGESDILPYKEEMPVQGRHPYDVSKSCADLLAAAYAATYELPVAVARCGNIFGGGDLNWSRIVPGTIRSVLQNQRPILRSDGKFRRDYVYMLDAVAAYLLLAEKLKETKLWGEAFNFSNETAVEVEEITRQILSLMGREDLEPVILNQASGEIRNQYLDATKAKRMLGWVPRYSLDEGLRETIAWYRQALAQSAGSL